MSYWSERQDELKEWMEKEEEKLKKRLERYYRTEAKKLDRQIASYYTQYGKDNVIEYRQLMENLDDEDLTLLIQQMDEFAKKYPQYAHLIPVRESIYKLNRLEGLQYSIKMQQLEMGAVTNEEVENYLIELGTKGANSSMEAMGFGKNFYSVNSDIVRGFVNTKWSDGKNFSDTIWQNTDKLSKYLNTDVAQGFARGDSYSKLTKMLTDRFLHVSKNDAYRLIYTEGTYVMAESSMQPFTEDFEQYKISTAKDGKVCSTCSKMAQQVFNINERKAGTNFPPFHPWCRCTFTIHVEDWDKWMDNYVSKNSKIKPDFENETIDKLRRSFKSLFSNTDSSIVGYEELPEKLKVDFKKGLSKSERNVGIVINEFYENLDYCLVKSETSKYSPKLNLVKIGKLINAHTLAHEIFHAIDTKYKISDSTDLLSLLVQDFNIDAIQTSGTDVVMMLQFLYPEAFEKGKAKFKQQFRGISDIINGISRGNIKLGYGHRDSYWNDITIKREAVAQYGSIKYTNDVEVVRMMETLFPSFTAEMDNIIQGLVK